MPLLLPFLTGAGTSTFTAAGQYPLNRSHTFQTPIAQFINGSEQRHQDRANQGSFILQYTAINDNDREVLDQFLSFARGQAEPFVFTLPSSSYGYCQFEDDNFSWQENRSLPGRYNGAARFRQTAISNVPANGTLIGQFPTVGQFGTIRTGYPFTRTSNLQTAKVDLPSGNRSAYPYFEAGLPGFPTRPLYSWTLTFATATDTDVAQIETHYINAAGRYLTFSFIDPTDGLYYWRVRYDMDALQIKHTAPNQSSLTVKLVEVFGQSWHGPTALNVFSTGVSAAGVQGFVGAVDTHYTLTASADGTYVGPNVYIGDGTIFYNYPESGRPSRYVCPGPTIQTNLATGSYTYRTSFSLAGFNLNSASLIGRWLCDDVGGNILLNGVAVPNTAYISNLQPFRVAVPFGITSGFVTGTNTLDFVVTNAGSSPNPSALRVDISGTATP
jgi:hypothetical protein